MFGRKTYIIVFACLLSLVAGCQTFKEGGNRTPGEVTDDLAIEASVKSFLVRDPEIKGFAIDVEVSRSIVTLFGRVPSTYARNRALKLAQSVKGVENVVDRLTLVEPK